MDVRGSSGRRGAGWLGVLILCGGTGCGVDIADPDPQAAEIPEPAPTVVTVRFQNFALDDAVDVEFYATNGPLGLLPDDLFTPENRITTSVGVAGTGIVTPLAADTVEVPCTETTTIGTLGGSFIDSETGEPRGIGVARWAQEGPLALCGATVTFNYTGKEGDYRTDVGIVVAP